MLDLVDDVDKVHTVYSASKVVQSISMQRCTTRDEQLQVS